MDNKKLTELPVITIPTSGSLHYIVDSLQSYQGTVDKLANLLISAYGLFSSPLSAGIMTTGNAEILLNGLNSSPNALLSSSRIDFSGADFFFNVDGGTFYDVYASTSNFDGGPIV